MAKKKASRQTRADSKQNMDSKAPVVTMDAFSNPAARIGFGGHGVSNDQDDAELPASDEPVPGELDHSEHHFHDPE